MVLVPMIKQIYVMKKPYVKIMNHTLGVTTLAHMQL